MIRAITLAFLFLLSSVHTIAFAEESPEQLLKGLGFKESVTTPYKRIPADIQALACSDPEQQADCKTYFAGFADTITMMYAMKSKTNGICGDTSDILNEFIQEVRTNPKANEAETHTLIFALLAKNHSCAKIKGRNKKILSAGYVIDTCKAGDIGFNLCSQYLNGFLNGLLFLSEKTETPLLCGDQRLINSVSLSAMLNDKLQSNYKLRRESAVKVALDELMANMPCSTK